MDNERIKFRVLVPLTAAIVGLIGAFVAGAFHLMNDSLDYEIGRQLTSARQVIKVSHHANVELLSKVIENLASNQRLKKAYIEGRRAETRAILDPVLHELFESHNVSDLCLYDTLGVDFVRIQRSPINGDTAQSIPLIKARETGRLFFGMDLRPGGAFSLRVAAPWHINDRLAGFIELGKKSTHITKEVPRALGVDMVTYIDKKYLSRERWEKTHSTPDSALAWDTFPNCVIIDNSFNGLPPLDKIHHPVESGARAIAFRKVNTSETSYCVADYPLVDVQNRVVGHFAIYYDATQHIQRTENLLTFISAICLAIGLGLFIFFYRILDGLERELIHSREKLELENARRLEVEQKHARELAVHVLELELARSRMVSIAPQAGRTGASAENERK